MELDASGAKLLCWNLLALASSDELEDNELDFIRYVSEKAGVEPSVFAEMENHGRSLVEVEKSIAQLKMSDKNYSEIEPLVSENMLRQTTILEAAQALVSDR